MPVVYLIPSTLHDKGLHAIPSMVLDAVKDCRVIFAENERTARRYLKKLDKNIQIDDFEWFTIDRSEQVMLESFHEKIKEEKNIAIISEAGCPGIADPGQQLVAAAQKMNVPVKPLVGPSSVLLALMASGMNGQRFQFHGYLPIHEQQRNKTIRELEAESKKKDCTQIFIETPYRNEQLVDALVKSCQPTTQLCIATDLTSPDEWIRTRPVSEWRSAKPAIHKKPAIFLLYAK